MQQLAQQELGRALTMDEFAWLINRSGVSIVDGDDENDNVANSGLTFKRVDVLKMGEAVLALAQNPLQVVRAESGLTTVADFALVPAVAINQAPTATINDHSVATNEYVQIQSWISYSDPDGDPATAYVFWDDGTAANSAYFWTPENAHQPANTGILVSAADLPNTWLRGGQVGGSETMWVRAFDGTTWGPWDSFTFTTVANANTPPVATISNHSVRVNEYAQIQSWISYFDANGNPATLYQFWDDGTAANSGYFWTPQNAHEPALTGILVSAAELSSVWLRGGQVAGSETMWVRAFDGTDWSAWDSFTFTTLPAGRRPRISESSLRIDDSQEQNANTYSDDSWALSNTTITANAADVADAIPVRTFDGTDWSAWDGWTSNTLG
jgi:hypothetical protein